MVVLIFPKDLKKKHDALNVVNVLFGHGNSNFKKIRCFDEPTMRVEKGRVVDEATGNITGEIPEIIIRNVIRSDGQPMIVDDILDDWSFGNGVTTMAGMPLKGGLEADVIIIVFYPLVAPQIKAMITVIEALIKAL